MRIVNVGTEKSVLKTTTNDVERLASCTSYKYILQVHPTRRRDVGSKFYLVLFQVPPSCPWLL